MAIHYGQEPQQELLQQATSHKSSVSSWQLTKLTPAQAEALKDDPKYQRLTQQLALFASRRSEYRREIMLKRNSRMEWVKRLKLVQVREEWAERQGEEDVARYVRGKGVEGPDAGNSRRPGELHPLQQSMVDAVQAPLINDFHAQFQGRTKAILALTAYLLVEERVVKLMIQLQRATLHPLRWAWAWRFAH